MAGGRVLRVCGPRRGEITGVRVLILLRVEVMDGGRRAVEPNDLLNFKYLQLLYLNRMPYVNNNTLNNTICEGRLESRT